MAHIIFNIFTSNGVQTCLGGFICANETFISIYGVIFTIVISLGVYVYGLQNKGEKITLTKNTDIGRVIVESLGSFAISFVSFPSPLYELVNFILVASVLFNLYLAFREVFKFNGSELSAERAVKKFKEGVIQEKLKGFEDLKIKNDLLNKDIEERSKGKEIERFRFDEGKDGYYSIRAQNSGYITNVDLSILFAREIDQASTEKLSYYIPYYISNGAPIDLDTVILGVKKIEGLEINEERLRTFVSISDEFDNPSSYLEAEIRSYYTDMFSLIKMGDAKSLEDKLKEFSSYVYHFTDKADSYADIIQFINDDIIFPLQKYAFKQGDVDCIRKIVSFSLGYIYRSLEKQSIQTFNIFSRNLTNAFYLSFTLEPKAKSEFHNIYFRWLNEISKYSIKTRLQKDKIDSEFPINFLSNLNGLLKIAFDHKDLSTFEKTLGVLNESFSRESYEHSEDQFLDKIILAKKAVIFGFTAWAYKDFSVRKEEIFYKEALSRLLNALQKDPTYYYGNIEDDLNYYLSVYREAVELSEGKGSFGWDTWDMTEGRVYTVTVRHDIKNLLTDRILKIFANKPDLVIDIKEGNFNEDLSFIKKGDQQFDPLFDKTKESFIATASITDEQFTAAKAKFYEVFSEINKKYEAEVRTKLIKQQIDLDKLDKFAKQNFDSYTEARVLYRVQQFNKDTNKKKDGFGYNIILDKAQFVKETNIHYVGQDELGGNLARAEDNRILEAIYKKFSKVSFIKKKEIEDLAAFKNGVKAIVLWVSGYITLEDGLFKDFEPYWKHTDSRKNNGLSYQGSLGGVPVHMVFKSDEYKSYPDTVFTFQNDAFSITEFELEQDSKLDKSKTKWKESPSECLILSITDLSSLKDARTEIVDNWIAKGTTPVSSKEAKIEDLKTNVLFKFYKGLSIESLAIKKSNVQVLHIE
jgi:hypothetical protein